MKKNMKLSVLRQLSGTHVSPIVVDKIIKDGMVTFVFERSHRCPHCGHTTDTQRIPVTISLTKYEELRKKREIAFEE